MVKDVKTIIVTKPENLIKKRKIYIK